LLAGRFDKSFLSIYGRVTVQLVSVQKWLARAAEHISFEVCEAVGVRWVLVGHKQDSFSDMYFEEELLGRSGPEITASSYAGLISGRVGHKQGFFFEVAGSVWLRSGRIGHKQGFFFEVAGSVWLQSGRSQTGLLF